MDKTGQRLFSPLRTQPNTGLPGLGHRGRHGDGIRKISKAFFRDFKRIQEILRDFKRVRTCWFHLVSFIIVITHQTIELSRMGFHICSMLADGYKDQSSHIDQVYKRCNLHSCDVINMIFSHTSHRVHNRKMH